MATFGKFNEIGTHLQAEIKKMGQSIPKATWDVGTWLKRQIKKRTLMGRGMDGRAFKPYSTRYAKKKGMAHVNLFGNRIVSHHGGPRMLDQIYADGKGNARFNPQARRFIPVKGSGGMFLAFKETQIFLTVREQARGRATGHQTGKGPVRKRRPFMGLARSEHRAFEAAFQSKVYRPRNTKEEIDIVLNFGGRGPAKR